MNSWIARWDRKLQVWHGGLSIDPGECEWNLFCPWGFLPESTQQMIEQRNFVFPSVDDKLRIEAPGDYRFVADTDDGARLVLDGRVLLDALWRGPGRRVSAAIWLESGWHDLEFVFRERNGNAGARLEFDESCPELGGSVLPAIRCAARFEPGRSR